ncbi:hypothetical protein OAA83_03015 [Candidatus Marinimicrobia bacterium]|nr:hypothetical protein [Candidatus Neomarinimicrobiota bacterium]
MAQLNYKNKVIEDCLHVELPSPSYDDDQLDYIYLEEESKNGLLASKD